MANSLESKPLALALVLLLTVASAGLAGTNEWSTEGPYGGNVRSVAVDPIIPSRIFAGTSNSGIWQSLDYGQTWRSSSLGQRDLQIHSVTTHPFEQGWVYSVSSSRVTRSIDFGNFWEEVTDGIDARFSGPLVINPQNGNDVYLGTLSDGVYKSTDAGSTWAPSSGGLPDAVVTDLAIDPSNPDVVYAAMDDQLVWRSDDAGATWTLLSTGLFASSVVQLALDPHQPSVVYAATYQGVFKTTTGGAFWSRTSQGLGDQFISSVAVDPRAPGVVYAGTLLGGGVYRSLDGGASWTPTDLDRTKTSVDQFAFDPDDPDRLYLAESRGGGVYRSTDGGASWQEKNEGLLATTVADFAIDPTTATAYAAIGFNGIARSTADGGWEPLPNSPRDGYCCDHVAIDPEQPQTLYAGGLDGLFKSVDGGTTWQTANQGFPRPALIRDLVIEPGNPARLFAATADGLFRTTNGGADWSRIGASVLGDTLGVAVAPSQPTTVLAVSFNQLFRSDDGGETWVSTTTFPSGFFFRSVAIDPMDPDVVWITDLSIGIYKSTDGGQNLVLVRPSNSADPILIDPEDSNTVFVGTTFGVLWSQDGGGNWEPFEGTIDPDFIQIRSLAISRGAVTTYYAGSFAKGAHTLTRGCEPDDEVLCIDDQPGDRRFAVSLFFSAGADSGNARAISLEPLGIDDGGILYFFTPENPEVLVKVVNGCSFNDRYWVFAAATTTLGYALEVEDTRTRARKIYRNPDDQAAETITDIDAFGGCDVPPNEFGLFSVPEPGRVADAIAAQEMLHAAPSQLTRTVTRRTVTTSTVTTSTVTTRDHDGAPCVADATTLCIDDEPGDARFEVRLHYDTVLGGGLSGDAGATPLAPLGITDGGIFSFFDPSNPEVLVKIIDGCSFNDSYWVFAAASTNLGFAIEVRDTHSETMVVYTNPDTRPAATVTDIDAFFTCDD